MDRLVGAIAALLLSLILWPFVEFKLEYNVSYPKNSLYVIIIVILLFIYLLKNRLYNFILKIIKLLTNHILGFIRATIVSIGTNLFFSLSVFLAVKGSHIDISLLQSVFVVSASMLFILIPVSFAGISAVDVASVAVLTGCGIKIEDAIIFALFSYVAKLIAAIQGGGWEIYEGGGDFTKSLANVINLKR